MTNTNDGYQIQAITAAFDALDGTLRFPRPASCIRCERARAANSRYCSECEARIERAKRPRPCEACGEAFTPSNDYCTEICGRCSSEAQTAHDCEARFNRYLGFED